LSTNEKRAGSNAKTMLFTRDVTKFAFEFDDVFSRFKIRQIFSRPIIEFKSQVYRRRMFTQTGHRNKLTTNVCCIIVWKDWK